MRTLLTALLLAFFSLPCFAQFSVAAGSMRLYEGLASDTRFFGDSRKQIYLQDYASLRIAYQGKVVGISAEGLYMKKGMEFNQNEHTQSGSGSSLSFHYTNTDYHSRLYFSYVGLKSGIDFKLAEITEARSGFYPAIYISIFHQIDFLSTLRNRDQVTYRSSYTSFSGGPYYPGIGYEAPPNYMPFNSVYALKTFHQTGIELRARINYHRYFAELSCGFARLYQFRISPNHEVIRESAPTAHLSIFTGIRLGYTFIPHYSPARLLP